MEIYNKIIFTGCLILLHFNAVSQSSSISTEFSNDSIKITYNNNGKENLIEALHLIPVEVLPFENALLDKQAKKKGEFCFISTLNYRLLDSLVWVACNKYRQGNLLEPVTWDDTIYKTSKIHSRYQAYFDVVGHGEDQHIPGRIEEYNYYKRVSSLYAEICVIGSFTEGKKTYSEIADISLNYGRIHQVIMR